MNTPNNLRALQILHKALLAGQLLFAVIAFFLRYTGSFNSQLASYDQMLQVIAIVISFSGVFIGSSLFKKKIQRAREQAEDVKTKSGIYRSASIAQWALLEAPSLFCIICFMLVGNYAFLALSAAIMCWFALTGPSKIKIMLLLGLNETEMENF